MKFLMEVAVGTTSELKLRAVGNAFKRAGFSPMITGHKVESGVPKQPFSEKEIVKGATNRARNALAKSNNADYGLGIESGIASKGGKYFDLAVCVVVNQAGAMAGEAFSAAVEVPKKIVHLVKTKGLESCAVAQKLGGLTEKDSLLWYTGSRLSRSQILEDAIFLALTKEFLNSKAYK